MKSFFQIATAITCLAFSSEAVVAPPVIIKVDPYTCTRTRIVWQNSDPNTTGFILFRNDEPVSFIEKDSSSYIDYGLRPGYTYWYSLKAVANSDTSIMSRVVYGKTFLLNSPIIISKSFQRDTLIIQFSDASEYESYHVLYITFPEDIKPVYCDTLRPTNKYNTGTISIKIPLTSLILNKYLMIKATTVCEDDRLSIS